MDPDSLYWKSRFLALREIQDETWARKNNSPGMDPGIRNTYRSMGKEESASSLIAAAKEFLNQGRSFDAAMVLAEAIVFDPPDSWAGDSKGFRDGLRTALGEVVRQSAECRSGNAEEILRAMTCSGLPIPVPDGAGELVVAAIGELEQAGAVARAFGLSVYWSAGLYIGYEPIVSSNRSRELFEKLRGF